MAETKTRPTGVDVTAFLNEVENERRRRDGFEVLEMMKEITRLEPTMWGPTMVGFGRYRYQYESGHKGEAFVIGFSPRKASLVLYVMEGMETRRDLLEKLGKHKASKGCLYINKLDDVDRSVLREIVQASFDAMADQRVE